MQKDEEKKVIPKNIKAASKKRASELGKKMTQRSTDNAKKIDSNFVRQCLELNQLGDGLLYAKLHQDKFIFNKTSNEWLVWTGHRWERDFLDDSLNRVEDVAEAYVDEQSRLFGHKEWAEIGHDGSDADRFETLIKKYDRRINRLRSQEGRVQCLNWTKNNAAHHLSIKGDELDADPMLLGCANGVVDLHLGELRPGHQHDYITKSSPVEWAGLDAPAPAWEKFLTDVFQGDKDTIEYLRRLFGYTLSGLPVERIFGIFCGDGQNGKGVLLEVLKWVMGSYAQPIPAELLLDQGYARSSSAPSPDIMLFRGLRMAFASETDNNRSFSTARVKHLSGGDTMVGRYGYDRHLSYFNPTHTLFLITNHKPKVSSTDSAFWSRCHVIPFRVAFVRREPCGDFERSADIYIIEKLKQEGPGILSWLVRGCLEWHAIGLDPPAQVLKESAEYRRDQDTLADFIEQCCITDTSLSCGSTDLYDAFRIWWAKNVSPKSIPSHKKFGEWMTKKFKKDKSGTYTYYGVDLLERLEDLEDNNL